MLYRNIESFKYQLASDETYDTGILGYSFDIKFIKITPDGKMLIREGYIWNGASGPTFDTPDSMKGSLIHDALYECLRRELLPLSVRRQADVILHDVCTAEGMIPKRADAWYTAVRQFAKGSALQPETKDNVTEV